MRELTGRDPLVFAAGPDPVRSIGIVSGAGASFVHDAVALGLDAVLTGEPAEHAMADAREGGVHFIAAGHYATETFGVRRLGRARRRALRRRARVHRSSESRLTAMTRPDFAAIFIDTSAPRVKT